MADIYLKALYSLIHLIIAIHRIHAYTCATFEPIKSFPWGTFVT